MRLLDPIIALTLLTAGLSVASPAPSQVPDPVDAVRRITVDEAVKMVGDGKAVYIDVRSSDAYFLGHIKGAIRMPYGEIVPRLRELPTDKTLITYCACTKEQISGRAVLQLNSHGIRNAAALAGGWDAWKAAKLPIESPAE